MLNNLSPPPSLPPSQTRIPDMSVVQFFVSGHEKYLSINSSGSVLTTANPNDDTSKQCIC